MYKTLNRVFSKKRLAKSRTTDAGDTARAAASEAPSTPPKGEPSTRPESPLRLGSPSVGEATVKRLVNRLFPADAFQEVQPEAPGWQVAADGAEKRDGARAGEIPPRPPRRKAKEVPAEMLAFEIGSIMRRMLEIHDSMSEKMLSSLRSNLQAPGVVTLIANDLRVLWGLGGYEKQQELRLVASRVAVLGRKSMDLRLRKLRVLFDDLDNPQASFQDYAATPEDSEMLVRFMREQAEATDNLKSEMESIQLLHTRIQEYGEWNSLQEMVTQGKLVEKLQGHCLWSYNLDYLIQVLVIAICSMRKRIFASFGNCVCPEELRRASLGESGLALHYANVVVLLERIIQQPDAVLGPTRMELYEMLPRNIQYQLRVQLQDPLNFTSDGRIEANLKRGLLLLPTMAHNTIHWHSRHTPGATLDSSEVVFQVQTFYYANRTAVNAALVDVLLGLCRICGVENPIGFISVQCAATADRKQVLARGIEEDDRAFQVRLGAEDRENKWGGIVTKTVDEQPKVSQDGPSKGTKSEAEQTFVNEAMAELAADRDGNGAAASGVGSTGGEKLAKFETELQLDETATVPASEAGGSTREGTHAKRRVESELQEVAEATTKATAGETKRDVLQMKRAQSARLSDDFQRPGSSNEDPISVARSSPLDLDSSTPARRAGVKEAPAGAGHFRKKSFSQKFSRGASPLRMQEWGLPWGGPPRGISSSSSSSSFGKPAGFGEKESSERGRRVASGASTDRGSRRALPAGGLVNCFAALADSDSESEDGAAKSRPRALPRTRDFGVKSITRHFGPTESAADEGLRKTKHYHSQPLARPKPDLS